MKKNRSNLERQHKHSRPVRVLHLIDGLCGGGSERLLWDIVRLSPPEEVNHRVVTIYPDHGDCFVYAEALRSRGAYPAGRSPGFLRSMYRLRASQRTQKAVLGLDKLLWLLLLLGYSGLTTWRVVDALVRFRPDVIHTHTFFGILYGLLMRAVLNKPLIHTVPSLFAQMRDVNMGWLPRVYARCHSQVDCFFTGMPRELLAVGVPPRKVRALPGAVDLQAVEAARTQRDRHRVEVRRSLGLSADARIALSVGRLHSAKGHSFALESLAALVPSFGNLHWVVLGEGPERASLEARTRELGVAAHVHLAGFHADPLPFYAAADIYLRTPIFEADNLSSYQAMALAVPVVGFDTAPKPSCCAR